MHKELGKLTIKVVQSIKIDLKQSKPKINLRNLFFYEGVLGRLLAWLMVSICILMLIITALVKADYIQSKDNLLILIFCINLILLTLAFLGYTIFETVKVFKHNPLISRLEFLNKEMNAVIKNLMSYSSETLVNAQVEIDFIIQYEKQRITYMMAFAILAVPFSVYRVLFTDFTDTINLLSQLNWPTIIVISFATGILGGGLLVQSRIMIWTRYSFFINRTLDHKKNGQTQL